VYQLSEIGWAVQMDLGYWILNDVIWSKTNPMPNFRGTRFTNATETLIWAKKSSTQKKYTFNYSTMKNLHGGKQMKNVWNIPLCTGAERLKNNGKKAHSTQKPEALLYRIILASSNPGDIILDPFFGSGTTGAVAKKLKRDYVGIEREKTYIDLARNRIDIIPLSLFEDGMFKTVSKKNQPRVPVGKLLESEYLRIGQTLFSKSRKHTAILKADGHLIMGSVCGSIHKVAAILLEKKNYNGWEFWYYENDDGDFCSIDILRDIYRRDLGLETND